MPPFMKVTWGRYTKVVCFYASTFADVIVHGRTDGAYMRRVPVHDHVKHGVAKRIADVGDKCILRHVAGWEDGCCDERNKTALNRHGTAMLL